METSEQINELTSALSKAQAKIEGASKDGLNPHFKARFASLASVWDAAREPLAANGLCVIQGASVEGASVRITTILAHSSGQWVRETLTMVARKAVKKDDGERGPQATVPDDSPQSVGSAITYGRRYQLAAMVGISPEDDDGEAAQGSHVPDAPLVPAPPKPKKAKVKTEPESESKIEPGSKRALYEVACELAAPWGKINEYVKTPLKVAGFENLQTVPRDYLELLVDTVRGQCTALAQDKEEDRACAGLRAEVGELVLMTGISGEDWDRLQSGVSALVPDSLEGYGGGQLEALKQRLNRYAEDKGIKP